VLPGETKEKRLGNFCCEGREGGKREPFFQRKGEKSRKSLLLSESRRLLKRGEGGRERRGTEIFLNKRKKEKRSLNSVGSKGKNPIPTIHTKKTVDRRKKKRMT